MLRIFFVWVKMWVRGLTHTVTHTRKGLNGHKNAGQEVCDFLPGFFFVLHDLFHEVPHGLGGFVLLLPGGVGVGAQGEPGIEVPQHGGHRLYIHAVLQGSGGEGVPEIVEPEMLQSGVLQDLFCGG